MDDVPIVGGEAASPSSGDGWRPPVAVAGLVLVAFLGVIGAITRGDTPVTTTTTITPIEDASNLVPSQLTWRTTTGLDDLTLVHDLVGWQGVYHLVGRDRRGLVLASSEDGALWIEEELPPGLDPTMAFDGFYQPVGDVLYLGVGVSPPDDQPGLWWRTGRTRWATAKLPASSPSTVTGLGAIADDVVVTGVEGQAGQVDFPVTALPDSWQELMAAGQAHVSFGSGGTSALLWIGPHRVAATEFPGAAPESRPETGDAVGWIGSPANGFEPVSVPAFFKLIGTNDSGEAFGVTDAGRLLVSANGRKWDDLGLATGFISDGVAAWAGGWLASASPTTLSYSAGQEWTPRGPEPIPTDAVLRNMSASDAGVAAIMDRTAWLERTARVEVPSIEGHRVLFDMNAGTVIQTADLRTLAEIEADPDAEGIVVLDGEHLVFNDPLTGHPVARVVVDDWNRAWAESRAPNPDEVSVVHSFDTESWSVLSVDAITGSQSSQARSIHLAGDIGLLVGAEEPSVWLATWETG